MGRSFGIKKELSMTNKRFVKKPELSKSPKQSDLKTESLNHQKPLQEGEDFYFENGLMVLTASYLLRRGYCCGNGCRNCPY